MDSYLAASELCDFDRDLLIVEKAAELIRGRSDETKKFELLYRFVKELPYGLEDWDVKASETLRKGWGMCCGKTNLLVAMSRALSIPARYRVFRIKAEKRLLEWVSCQQSEVATGLGDLPLEQDHLDCEVYLDGSWHEYDPSRDTAFENGLRRLGIPLKREAVVGADGAVQCSVLASIDRWAKDRQERRRFRQRREAVFAMVNEQLAEVRRIGTER